MSNDIKLLQYSSEDLKVLFTDFTKPLLNEFKKELENKKDTKLLSRQETANFLGVNLTSLWTYTKKGYLQSYGIGNRVMYKLDEVENSLIKINK